MNFRSSNPFTLGVELQLQLIDPSSGQLSDSAPALVGKVSGLAAEVTQAMVEYNSPICESAPELYEELEEARDEIVGAAQVLNLEVCGGGLHPFQRWPERQVSGGERFGFISRRYAYLAQMSTVFGQHIHVGCRNGEDALYLTHALSRYVPHFIALAASSPFYRNVDTQFDCARLNMLAAFPTCGRAPLAMHWEELEEHVSRLKELHVVKSMKDLYWDIRPKPDTGTVEIRVCDTPLTLQEAVDLAAYVQLLAYDLLEKRDIAPNEDLYLPYRLNRFQACRYGFKGVVTEPATGRTESIRQEILRTLERLWPHAHRFDCADSVARLGDCAEQGINGAAKLRKLAEEGASFPQIVAAQAALWAGAWSTVEDDA